MTLKDTIKDGEDLKGWLRLDLDEDADELEDADYERAWRILQRDGWQYSDVLQQVRKWIAEARRVRRAEAAELRARG